MAVVSYDPWGKVMMQNRGVLYRGKVTVNAGGSLRVHNGRNTNQSALIQFSANPLLGIY